MQSPVPGIVTTARRRRPKVTVVTHIAVGTITAVAVTSGKTSETTFISCPRIRTIPADVSNVASMVATAMSVIDKTKKK